ncbi:heavy metal-binding domain-containing protein [uncultured Arcticibacterium sp.]|uniref:heavy metal-binding domain-containing protein n=1 Tax=uncultured Arcticibacterium sp. TaxID=2173042 RepID=UPI0030F7B6DF
MMKSKLVLSVLFLGLLGACSSESGDTEMSGSEELAHVHYACPMECEADKVYEEAGKCPVCKMDLAEVSSDGE